MHGLVLELQADSLNRNVSCADLLRKALVVSRKLGIEEIEDWLRHELNGYPIDNDSIPDYRKIRGQVKVCNPYHGWQPLNFEDAKEAERLSKRKIIQAVGELDTLLERNNGGPLQVPFSPAITNNLMRGMDMALQPTLHVSVTEVVGILDSVRNSILEWALGLESNGVIGEQMTFSNEEKEAANQVTYQITNNIGSMDNSQIQQHSAGATQSLVAGTNLEGLKEFLEQVRSTQNELHLDADTAREFEAEISTLESQVESPKPKSSIISESLRTVRSILEGATGSIAATGLLTLVASLV